VRNCKYIYIYILYVYINRTQFKKFTILLRYSIRKGTFIHIFSDFDKILCFTPNDLWTTHKCRYKCIHKTPSNSIMWIIITYNFYFFLIVSIRCMNLYIRKTIRQRYYIIFDKIFGEFDQKYIVVS